MVFSVFFSFFVLLRVCYNNLPHLASIFQTNVFPRSLSSVFLCHMIDTKIFFISNWYCASYFHDVLYLYTHTVHSQYFQYNFCFGSWFKWANLKWCFHHLFSYKSIQFVPHFFTKALLKRNWNNKLEKKRSRKIDSSFWLDVWFQS